MRADVKSMTVEMDAIETCTLHIVIPKSQISGIEDLKEPLEIEISRKKKKRSREANAYLWVLCDKIAKKLHTSKEDVYRQEIKEAGVWDIFAGVTQAAVDRMAENWSKRGIGYVSEKLDGTTPEGYPQIILYWGSSSYDTEQMSRLIDMVVQDAQELGIETATPNEISLMKQEWKATYA